MNSNLFIIAQSGWKRIGFAVASFIIFSIFGLDFFATVAIFFVLFFIYIYRNPERQIASSDAKALLSPVDGTVTKIETLENEEFTYMIEVESSYKNVSLLRTPINARVIEINLQRGTRLAKYSSLFEKLNENVSVVFETEEAGKIKILHKVTRSIVPIDIMIQKDMNLTVSSRYGVMANGISRIYLESDIRLNIQVGQEIKAAETLIAYSS